MKKIKVFYLKNCPHCRRAFKMIEDIKSENKQYQNLQFELIEESKNVKLANTYDYYFVPTFYVGDVKIHEGIPTRKKMEAVLKSAL